MVRSAAATLCSGRTRFCGPLCAATPFSVERAAFPRRRRWRSSHCGVGVSFSPPSERSRWRRRRRFRRFSGSSGAGAPLLKPAKATKAEREDGVFGVPLSRWWAAGVAVVGVVSRKKGKVASNHSLDLSLNTRALMYQVYLVAAPAGIWMAYPGTWVGS